MKRILSEPVVQFGLFGAAIFAYFSLTGVSDTETGQDRRIEVDEWRLGVLSQQYETVRGLPPSPQELENLVEAFIREEVMVRSALELGLDKGDGVVRNRMQQKMQFLTSAAAQSATPSDTELQAHLEAHQDVFTEPGRISFTQVFLGQSPDEDVVDGVLQALEAGADPLEIGARSMLRAQVDQATDFRIDAEFGRGFARGLQDLPEGVWQGPVRSGFGLHFVKVTAREAGRLPELAEIRDKVETDWRRVQANELADRQFQSLLAQYSIVRPTQEVMEKVLSE